MAGNMSEWTTEIGYHNNTIKTQNGKNYKKACNFFHFVI